MSLFARGSVTIAIAALALCDSLPFIITASSSNLTLNGMHAYIDVSTPYQYESVLAFTSNPNITPTNFTLDRAGHWLAHATNIQSDLLEANINNDAYDETAYFSSLEIVASGQNPILCHKATNSHISCWVTSEGLTRLSKLYVCPQDVGYHTIGGALKIGNAAQMPVACSSVQLNYTTCLGQC